MAEARLPRGLARLPVLDGIWVRLILALMVLVASAALFSGTAATLNSTTVNPGTGFATGKLILSNQVRDRNPCLSTGPRVSCEALFPGFHAPGVPATAQVTITNVGTLPVATLDLWSTVCKASAAAPSKPAGVDLCTNTWLTLHDDNHDLCYFPVKAAGSCTTAVHGSFSDFVTQHSEKNPLSLAPDHLGGGNVYTMTATIDPSLGNEAQGQVADIDFIWQITNG